jgi:hypothetical protein
MFFIRGFFCCKNLLPVFTIKAGKLAKHATCSGKDKVINSAGN